MKKGSLEAKNGHSTNKSDDNVILRLSRELKNGATEKEIQKVLDVTSKKAIGLVGCLRQLTMLYDAYITSDCPESLQTIMLLQYSSLEEHIHSAKTKSLKRLLEVRKSFLNLLNFLHTWRPIKEAFPHMSYEDILAGILSIYVELIILISRKSGDDVKQWSRHLCSITTLLFRGRINYGLDVIIQVKLQSCDGDLLLPLIKKVLSVPDCSTERLYTKYMICAHLCLSLYNTKLTDIRQIALQQRAPKLYIDWLKQCDEKIIEQMPVTKKFKRGRITRFLLEEAEEQIFESLLDILTLDESFANATDGVPQEPTTAAEDIQDQPESYNLTTEPPALDTLFFIDKSNEFANVGPSEEELMNGSDAGSDNDEKSEDKRSDKDGDLHLQQEVSLESDDERLDIDINEEEEMVAVKAQEVNTESQEKNPKQENNTVKEKKHKTKKKKVPTATLR